MTVVPEGNQILIEFCSEGFGIAPDASGNNRNATSHDLKNDIAEALVLARDDTYIKSCDGSLWIRPPRSPKHRQSGETSFEFTDVGSWLFGDSDENQASVRSLPQYQAKRPGENVYALEWGKTADVTYYRYLFR